MIDKALLYDIIYALAAKDGREGVLFGKSAPAAHDAFTKSHVGEAFPELWFEVPLAGDPWFDLHVLTSREALDAGQTFTEAETGGYPELFSWFAGERGGRQLALSWDTGSGKAEEPAVQLLVYTADPKPTCDFLDAAGKHDAIERYMTFRSLMPQGWFACYTGVFPSRNDQMLRVECIPDGSFQKAYVQDPSLLESHLRSVGLDVSGATLLERSIELARTPFMLEFQFDIASDGRAGETFGASLRFNYDSNDDAWQPFDPAGAAGDLMKMLESWGLADDRWRLLADASYSKRLSNGDESKTMLFYPGFIKLRWRGGEPLDAKTYLQTIVVDS